MRRRSPSRNGVSCYVRRSARAAGRGHAWSPMSTAHRSRSLRRLWQSRAPRPGRREAGQHRVSLSKILLSRKSGQRKKGRKKKWKVIERLFPFSFLLVTFSPSLTVLRQCPAVQHHDFPRGVQRNKLLFTEEDHHLINALARGPY